MERPDREEIEMFMSIAGSSEAIAMQKLEEYHDINDALNAYFSGGDRNLAASSRGTSVASPQDDFMDSGNRDSSSPLDLTDDRNMFDDFSDPTNQSLFVTEPREVWGTPIGGSARPVVHAHSFENLPEGSDDIEEQMIRAAIEASKQDFEDPELLDVAIFLSFELAMQENAQRLHGDDVSALRMGPPESYVGKLVNIEASYERSQAGSSLFQDEAEDAEELSLIRSRSRSISPISKDLAQNGDNPQHTRSVIHDEQDDEYLSSLQADKEKRSRAVEEAEAACEEEESHKILQEEKELERQFAAREGFLPAEPSLDDENAVTLKVRMPDGSRLGRQLLKSDNL